MEQGRHVFELALNGKRITAHISTTPHLQKHRWNNSRHNNADYELHLVLRGECRLEIADDRFSLGAEQAILIAPGQYHQTESAPCDFEHFSLSFRVAHAELREALARCVPTYHVFPVTTEMVSACRAIFHETASRNAFRQEMLYAQVMQLVLYAFRAFGVTEESTLSPRDAVAVVRTDIMDEFFAERFTEPVTEADLAEELHLSRRQAERVLQACYGVGFREKLLLTRMDHAAWLLRNTDKRIGEIVGLVGYTSEAAFFQAFRKTFSITPHRYRKQFAALPTAASER